MEFIVAVAAVAFILLLIGNDEARSSIGRGWSLLWRGIVASPARFLLRHLKVLGVVIEALILIVGSGLILLYAAWLKSLPDPQQWIGIVASLIVLFGGLGIWNAYAPVKSWLSNRRERRARRAAAPLHPPARAPVRRDLPRDPVRSSE